MKHPVEKHPVR